MQLLKYLDQEVVQGACVFLLKAKVYNSVHGYENVSEMEKNRNGGSWCESKKKKV